MTLAHTSALSRLGHALSDGTRTGVLLALRDAPARPSDLARSLGVSKQVMSNQLACLRGCGLVTATARSLVTVLQAVAPDFPLQAVLAGRYHDRFTWTVDGWAWVERRMTITLRGDTSRHSVHQL